MNQYQIYMNQFGELFLSFPSDYGGYWLQDEHQGWPESTIPSDFEYICDL